MVSSNVELQSRTFEPALGPLNKSMLVLGFVRRFTPSGGVAPTAFAIMKLIEGPYACLRTAWKNLPRHE